MLTGFLADASPELECYLQEAARRSPRAADTAPTATTSPRVRRNLLTLTLDNAVTLPALVRNHPTCPWGPDGALASREGGGGGRSWVEAVCRLFGFLVAGQ